MKFTNILCRLLCIYGSQVPACVIGGGGVGSGLGFGSFMGVGARSRSAGGARKYVGLVWAIE